MIVGMINVRRDLKPEMAFRAGQLGVPRGRSVHILRTFGFRRGRPTQARVKLVETIPACPGAIEHLLAAATSADVTGLQDAIVVATGSINKRMGGEQWVPALRVIDGNPDLIEVPLNNPKKGQAAAQILYLAVVGPEV